ncbi:MAG TPA: hypothetical protein PKD34_02060 [Candidatus Doudnabacteria bacterium]|nr:hypothetical protein [Candidatus Doudnabacteria bacterium]
MSVSIQPSDVVLGPKPYTAFIGFLHNSCAACVLALFVDFCLHKNNNSFQNVGLGEFTTHMLNSSALDFGHAQKLKGLIKLTENSTYLRKHDREFISPSEKLIELLSAFMSVQTDSKAIAAPHAPL